MTTGEHTPLKKRSLYKEDWLGLKTLDEKKGLVFLEAEGGHVRSLQVVTNTRCKSHRNF